VSRRLPLLALLLCSLLIAACGQEAQDEGGYQTENAQVAETEGIYLDLGGIKYQVQLSKQLNPALPDDAAFVDGVTGGDTLADDEVWFAVFMRAENVAKEATPLAEEFKIFDTTGMEFRPEDIDERNPWSYQPTMIEKGDKYPGPNSPAGERSPNGAMLLFKVKRASLDNRPLELEIVAENGDKGIVDLDV
jgi:hypothetical protein